MPAHRIFARLRTTAGVNGRWLQQLQETKSSLLTAGLMYLHGNGPCTGLLFAKSHGFSVASGAARIFCSSVVEPATASGGVIRSIVRKPTPQSKDDVSSRLGVGLITLNQPKTLNALSSELMRSVVAAAQEFDADPNVGAIVLTGSSRAFAAGADIKEMANKSFADAYATSLFNAWDALARVRKPLVAAVDGYALGGGCELAMMCDIIIAGHKAKFGQPELSLGVIPGMGATQRLTHLVGRSRAMDMILTGRMLSAEEAERFGLVSRVVPSEQLVEAAMAIGFTIASFSAPAVALAKEAVRAAAEVPESAGVALERKLFYSCFALQDQKEGMAAFIEKRKPEFKDR